jgi:hypothetical protein
VRSRSQYGERHLGLAQVLGAERSLRPGHSCPHRLHLYIGTLTYSTTI